MSSSPSNNNREGEDLLGPNTNGEAAALEASPLPSNAGFGATAPASTNAFATNSSTAGTNPYFSGAAAAAPTILKRSSNYVVPTTTTKSVPSSSTHTFTAAPQPSTHSINMNNNPNDGAGGGDKNTSPSVAAAPSPAPARQVSFGAGVAPLSAEGVQIQQQQYNNARKATFQSIGGGKYLPTAEAVARSDRKRGKGVIFGVATAADDQDGDENDEISSVATNSEAVLRRNNASGAGVAVDVAGTINNGNGGILGATLTVPSPQVGGGGATRQSNASVNQNQAARMSTATDRDGNAEELYSDDSVESDFDYDDEGKPRTFYKRAKKSTLSQAVVAESIRSSAVRASGAGAPGVKQSFLRSRITSLVGGPSADKAPLLNKKKKGTAAVEEAASRFANDEYGRGSMATVQQSFGPSNEYNGAVSMDARVPLNAFYDSAAATRASVKMRVQSFMSARSPSVMQLPEGLQGLGRQIHKLETEDLLYISSMVSRKAYREAFSVLQYTGKAWYLPSVRKRKPEEGEIRDWDWPRYKVGEGLVLTIGGRIMTIQLSGYLLRALVLGIFWLMLWSALPAPLSEPQGYIFDFLLVYVVSAIVGGFICRLLQIPPLVGVLWVAIVLNNVPSYHQLTHGILPEVKVIGGRMGLTVVLLRAGFSTSWKAMRPLWKNVAILAVVALLLEGGVHTAMTYYLFDYGSWTWAALEGFMCSVPSAAIIVPTALLLQSDGLSKTTGPLPFLLSTVGLETVMGVWLVTFIAGLCVGGTDNMAMAIGMGPVQIVGGIILGIILAYAFVLAVYLLKNEAKRLPNGEFTEEHINSVNTFTLVLFLLLAFAVVFFGYKFELGGGACVTVMMFATMTAHLWLKDGDPELMEQKRALGMGLCGSWELLIMPLLFSMTGTKVNLATIFSQKVFPKGLLIWTASVATRLVVVFACCAGLKFSLKEKLYACGSWAAKATVQSALAGVALTAINKKIDDANPDDKANMASLLRDQERAEMVQNVSILFVILSAPTAAAWMMKLGPKFLPKE